MRFIVPGQGQFVPNGTDRAVPFDGKDPFIFHSIPSRNIEVAKVLIKEDAALAPLDMTHKFVGDRDEAQPIYNSPLIQPWIRAGLEYRGDIQPLDMQAKDVKYLFTTPGYAYRITNVTFAFRLSTLLSRGNLRFRVNDIYADLDFAQEAMLNEIADAGDDEDAKESAQQDFFDQVDSVVFMSTLSPDLSRIMIPDYIRTRGFNGSTLGPIATCIAKDAHGFRYMKKIHFDALRMQWDALMDPATIGTKDDVKPETLFDSPLPLKAAELVSDPESKIWSPMSTFTGNQLSGLGRALIKTNYRRLIPGWKY